MDAFTEFEHAGWERVAGKYDSTWSTSTRQFIGPLLDGAEVAEGMAVLDVGCGPGYVSAAASERGATLIGVDFPREMVGIDSEGRLCSRRAEGIISQCQLHSARALLLSACMNASQTTKRSETAAISSEALIGLGIAIGALGLLAVLLGWAQHMRSVPEGAMLGFSVGGGCVLLGVIIAAAARARKAR